MSALAQQRFAWTVAAMLSFAACSSPAPPQQAGDLEHNAGGATAAEHPAPPYPAPYEQLDPAAIYVAEQRCAECHAEIAAAFAQHPMGRSLARVSAAQPIERYDPDADLPLKIPDYHYDIDRTDGKVIHREVRLGTNDQPVLTIEREVAYAVGSGQRGRSYLAQQRDRLLMSPLTWYPQRAKWDLSPGYERNNSHFYRPVVGECLFCHAGHANWDADSINRYREPVMLQEAIGCQRCHGPGEPHVRKHAAGGIVQSATDKQRDLSIVNPAHLTNSLALDVCAQCHLSGTARVIGPGREVHDFRPGKRLADDVAIYVERHDHGTKFVSHVEQMQDSRCFTGSDGALRCTSCHDPHRAPSRENSATFYRDRCLKCHQDRGCTQTTDLRESTSPPDNCLTCHMPQQKTEIRHAAVSDHRIPRRPISVAAFPPTMKPAKKPALANRLVLFDRTASETPDYPLARNNALAMLLAIEADPTAFTADDLAAVQSRLENAVRELPDDLLAREGLGAIYLRQNQFGAALAQFEHVLRDHPSREYSLSGAGRAMQALGRYREAVDYWRGLVDLNPSLPLYAAELALCLGKQHAWPACQQACRDTLARFPDHFATRQLYVECLLALGDPAGAEREMNRLRELNPPQLQAAERWFREHPLQPKP